MAPQRVPRHSQIPISPMAAPQNRLSAHEVVQFYATTQATTDVAFTYGTKPTPAQEKRKSKKSSTSSRHSPATPQNQVDAQTQKSKATQINTTIDLTKPSRKRRADDPNPGVNKKQKIVSSRKSVAIESGNRACSSTSTSKSNTNKPRTVNRDVGSDTLIASTATASSVPRVIKPLRRTQNVPKAIPPPIYACPSALDFDYRSTSTSIQSVDELDVELFGDMPEIEPSTEPTPISRPEPLATSSSLINTSHLPNPTTSSPPGLASSSSNITPSSSTPTSSLAWPSPLALSPRPPRLSTPSIDPLDLELFEDLLEIEPSSSPIPGPSSQPAAPLPRSSHNINASQLPTPITPTPSGLAPSSSSHNTRPSTSTTKLPLNLALPSPSVVSASHRPSTTHSSTSANHSSSASSTYLPRPQAAPTTTSKHIISTLGPTVLETRTYPDNKQDSSPSLVPSSSSQPPITSRDLPEAQDPFLNMHLPRWPVPYFSPESSSLYGALEESLVRTRGVIRFTFS